MSPVLILASLSVAVVVLVAVLVARDWRQPEDEPTEHGDGE